MITIVWKTENITKKRETYTRLRVTAVLVTGRSEPRYLGENEQQFQSDTTMLMELLETAKILPAAAFERHQYGGYKHMPHTLEAAGFARCYRL